MFCLFLWSSGVVAVPPRSVQKQMQDEQSIGKQAKIDQMAKLNQYNANSGKKPVTQVPGQK